MLGVPKKRTQTRAPFAATAAASESRPHHCLAAAAQPPRPANPKRELTGPKKGREGGEGEERNQKLRWQRLND